MSAVTTLALTLTGGPQGCGTQRWSPSFLKDSGSAVARITSSDFRATLQKVVELMDEEDDDDRPTLYAHQRASKILKDTAEIIGMRFPKALATTGPSQGVRLLWQSGGCEVRLVVGGSVTNKSYIYWRDDLRSGVSHETNPELLAVYLCRMGNSI